MEKLIFFSRQYRILYDFPPLSFFHSMKLFFFRQEMIISVLEKIFFALDTNEGETCR